MSYTTFKPNDTVFVTNIGYGTLLSCGNFNVVSLKNEGQIEKRESIYFDPDLFNSDDSSNSKKNPVSPPKPQPKKEASPPKQPELLPAPPKKMEQKEQQQPVNIVKVRLEGTKVVVHVQDCNIKKSVVVRVKPMFARSAGTINVSIEITKTIESFKKEIFDYLGLKIAYYYNIKLFTTSPTLSQLSTHSKTISQCGIGQSSIIVVTAQHGFCFESLPAGYDANFSLPNNSMTLANIFKEAPPKIPQPQLPKIIPLGDGTQPKAVEAPVPLIVEIQPKIVDVPGALDGNPVVQHIVELPHRPQIQIVEAPVIINAQIQPKIVEVPVVVELMPVDPVPAEPDQPVPVERVPIEAVEPEQPAPVKAADKVQQPKVVEAPKTQVKQDQRPEQKKVQQVLHIPKFFLCKGDTHFSSGKHYWEVKLDILPKNPQELQIGVLNQETGQSWIFAPLQSKKIYSSGPQDNKSEAYGKSCKDNDSIGVLLQFSKDKTANLYFYKSHVGLGVCFEGIKGPLRPVCGVGPQGQISLDSRTPAPIDSYRLR